MKQDDKLISLLNVVIDTYIDKGEPVWSKFLNTLENIDYAPSTLRKYLNQLEKQGMVYQPYNSSGRIPTVEGLKCYLENYLEKIEENNKNEVINARKNMKELVEMLWGLVDGVYIDDKILKNNQIYYTFIESGDIVISTVYTKVVVEAYDCILAVVWPMRVDYKKNVAILSQLNQKLQ